MPTATPSILRNQTSQKVNPLGKRTHLPLHIHEESPGGGVELPRNDHQAVPSLDSTHRIAEDRLPAALIVRSQVELVPRELTRRPTAPTVQNCKCPWFSSA
uniref:(northern house mosquito) hypothetical protein n=1 Tax=Culex pipiens TaxID=7175 RepID=A0A8D7ZZP7_CULPI